MRQPSRRDLIRGALGAAGLSAVGLVAACTGPADPVDSTSAPGPTDPTAPPSADVDRDVVTAAIAGEQQLIATYDAAIAAYPALAATLAPIREQHIAHADALGSVAPPAPGEATGSPGTAPGGGSAATALEALAQTERTAAEARTRECAEATVSDTVRLLALIAASESSHAEALAGAALTAAP